MNKAELKREALEVRQEIGLGPLDVFDPYRLAEEYGVEIYRLSDLECRPEALAHFGIDRVAAFSGALIPVEGGAVILENDHHDPRRRRATAGHEMAHLIRGHTFATRVVNEKGCRTADKTQEAEAVELGAELLLPFEGALRLAHRGASDAEAAQRYEVSEEFARWRLHHTGARKIAERSAAKRRRA